MKRTVETILSIIGIIGYGFVGVLGGLMLFLQNNESFLREIMEEDPELFGDLESFAAEMGAGGWTLIITAIIALIAVVIALILLKGNKKPKAAGGLLLAVAIIGSIMTAGFGAVSGILFFIAGIMCFVRREPVPQV